MAVGISKTCSRGATPCMSIWLQPPFLKDMRGKIWLQSSGCSCREEFRNLQNLISAQVQIRSAHYALGLLRAARTHDGSGHRRILQSPGDCDLACGAPVPGRDLLQQIDQSKIA